MFKMLILSELSIGIISLSQALLPSRYDCKSHSNLKWPLHVSAIFTNQFVHISLLATLTLTSWLWDPPQTPSTAVKLDSIIASTGFKGIKTLNLLSVTIYCRRYLCWWPCHEFLETTSTNVHYWSFTMILITNFPGYNRQITNCDITN